MVFVLDRKKKPLMPCREKRARHLLERGRARVHRMQPFTIRLVDRVVEESALQPVRLKLDPGSKVTGMAVVREDVQDPSVQATLHLAELEHRGVRIRKALDQRRAYRRGRRNRHTRYRAPRFLNRRRSEGTLAPSLRHRVLTALTWVKRYRSLCPLTGITTESVRFDTHKLVNPDVEGVNYQHGTLWGYETREYVLERDGHACAYCDAKDLPLNLDHVVARACGGSNRPSNLVASCIACNLAKGTQPLEDFLANDPPRLARIQARLQASLKDAAAVNATRTALVEGLEKTGLPVETSSGGQTRWNRHRLKIPKMHALDAASTGDVSQLEGWQVPVLGIRSAGRGAHARTRTDAYGFARLRLPRSKTVRGFRTGDLVQATIPAGKKAGTYVGRVAVRSSGAFNVQTAEKTIQGIGARHCRVLQRDDGYGYRPCRPNPTETGASSRSPEGDGCPRPKDL